MARTFVLVLATLLLAACTPVGPLPAGPAPAANAPTATATCDPTIVHGRPPDRVPAVDRPCIGRLNYSFGLSFETVTALRGGHFAHRPCRDLVTAAALRPGT